MPRSASARGRERASARNGDDARDIRARAFWSGTITFGLVSIPVNLFPGVRSHGVGLRMLNEDGVPLSRRFFCPKQDREVSDDEIVRGYEIEKDEYVVVTEDELEALEPRKSRDIDLRRFVPAEQIEPIYFERSYFLTPAGESAKAYRLLAESLEQNKRAGIATFVMRGKEYLIAITAEDGIMRADTLRFADELRSTADVGLPKKPPKVKAADVTKMRKLISSHAKTTVAESELEDEYAEKLQKLVAKKERKHEDIYELPEEAEESQRGDADVIDLVEVLKKSLQSGGNGKATRKRAHKSGAKKHTTRKRKTAAKR